MQNLVPYPSAALRIFDKFSLNQMSSHMFLNIQSRATRNHPGGELRSPTLPGHRTLFDPTQRRRERLQTDISKSGPKAFLVITKTQIRSKNAIKRIHFARFGYQTKAAAIPWNSRTLWNFLQKLKKRLQVRPWRRSPTVRQPRPGSSLKSSKIHDFAKNGSKLILRVLVLGGSMQNLELYRSRTITMARFGIKTKLLFFFENTTAGEWSCAVWTISAAQRRSE